MDENEIAYYSQRQYALIEARGPFAGEISARTACEGPGIRWMAARVLFEPDAAWHLWFLSLMARRAISLFLRAHKAVCGRSTRRAGDCQTAHGTRQGPRRAAMLFPGHRAGTPSFGKRCRSQACDIGKSRARGRTAFKASRRAERGQGAVCAAKGVGYRGAAAVVALNEQLPPCFGACMAPCFCFETYSARRVDMILFKIKC